MGRPQLDLDVTADERRELQAIASSRSFPHGLVRRAQMILWSDEGLTMREIARRTQVTPAAVSNWRKRFREARVAGLHDALKSGRPRTLDDERIAELLNAALLRKPDAATHWTVRGLADDTGVAKSSVQRYLKLFGVHPHRAKSFKLSTDPFFIEKVRDIVGLYLNPPDHALVLCVDEKSQVQPQPALNGSPYLMGSATALGAGEQPDTKSAPQADFGCTLWVDADSAQH